MPFINSPFLDRGIPDECHEKMKEFGNGGYRIRWVAFPPAGGNRWSVVTDKAFFNRNIPDECHDKMKEFVKAGHKILCVAFPPAGGNSWSVVTDKAFFNRNIPDECHDKMKEFVKAGHKILCVAFPPAGGNSWSVITDKAFFNRNIPDECHDKMKVLSAGGTKILAVGFPKAGGNRWSVVGDKTFFNRKIPGECHRVMRAMAGTGLGPLRVAAFHPDGGFVVLSRGDALFANHPQLSVGNELFSLAKFADDIRSQLDGKGCKYALMVRYGPAIRTATDGPKRTAKTPPAQDFTVFDRFNPASVAKTVTGVVLLQLLEKQNLTINEKIHKHLPSSWIIGPSVNTITVKELLNHTSGFRSGATTYDDLRNMVETGIKLADKVPSYKNCNYALARIVAAYINGNDESAADQAKATSENFIGLAQKNVFDRLGTPAVEWKPDADAPTLFYPTPPGESTGTAYGDWSLRPGSAGSHLSIAELSLFVNALADSDLLLSSSMRTKMDANGLGWGKVEDVEKGWYYRKRGYFPAGQNGGAALNSGIWKFSTGVQAVVLHNGSPEVDMPKAYDDAWA
jgi:CubicO group peptidase (beta-lactamase class C family)